MLASALVVAAAGGVLAATGSSQAPAVDACAPGRDYVTVRPVFDRSDWRPAQQAGPALAGCLDTSRIGSPDGPTPTNPRG